MSRGKIIFLNGVSGSGKTTLSTALQAGLDEPYYYIANDTFSEIICPFIASKGKFSDRSIMDKALPVMYLAITEFSKRGLNVIVDHPIADSGTLFNNSIDTLHRYPVLFVRVECDRDELIKRERDRGNRPLGRVDNQLELFYVHNIYDITINTFINSIKENVATIRGALDTPDKWNAFKRLKLIIDDERNATIV